MNNGKRGSSRLEIKGNIATQCFKMVKFGDKIDQFVIQLSQLKTKCDRDNPILLQKEDLNKFELCIK